MLLQSGHLLKKGALSTDTTFSSTSTYWNKLMFYHLKSKNQVPSYTTVNQLSKHHNYYAIIIKSREQRLITREHIAVYTSWLSIMHITTAEFYTINTGVII